MNNRTFPHGLDWFCSTENPAIFFPANPHKDFSPYPAHFMLKKLKRTFSVKRRRSARNQSATTSDRESSKSVRFSQHSEVVYTYDNEEYDRRSSFSTIVDNKAADHLKENVNVTETEDNELSVLAWDEEVLRNTRYNKRQTHHSIAVIVAYRAVR